MKIYLIFFCLFSNCAICQVTLSREEILKNKISKISVYSLYTSEDSLALNLREFDTSSATRVFNYYSTKGLLVQRDYFNTHFVKRGVTKYIYNDTMLISEIDNAYESVLNNKTGTTSYDYDSIQHRKITVESNGNLELVTYYLPFLRDKSYQRKYQTLYYAYSPTSGNSSCQMTYKGKNYSLQRFDLYSYRNNETPSRIDTYYPNNDSLKEFIHTISEIVVQHDNTTKETITFLTGFSTASSEDKIVECNKVSTPFEAPSIINVLRQVFKNGKLVEAHTNDIRYNWMIEENYIYGLDGLITEIRKKTTNTIYNSTSYSKVFYLYSKS